MITVYLDTSDYSVFGDVVRGLGSEAALRAKPVYERLLYLKSAGVARFAYSMPILSELIQYDPAHSETSFAKARAVEALCDENAFIWPLRLIAHELAEAAYSRGIVETPPAEAVLSQKSQWFPSVEGALDTMKADFETAIATTIANANTTNRGQRRMIEARARKLNLTSMAAAAIPELAEQYGLRVEDVRNALLPVLNNRITPNEGSFRLFSAIARPTAFVRTYFERYGGKKDLPFMMSDMGATIQANLIETRTRLEKLGPSRPSRFQIESLLAPMAEQISGKFIELSSGDAMHLGVPQSFIDLCQANPTSAHDLPCCTLFSTILLNFYLVNTGLQGDSDKPERSGAGDLFHSLYLPHTDLWRTDRRFAHLVRTATPKYAPRVVTRLRLLPNAIEQLHLQRGGSALRP